MAHRTTIGEKRDSSLIVGEVLNEGLCAWKLGQELRPTPQFEIGKIKARSTGAPHQGVMFLTVPGFRFHQRGTIFGKVGNVLGRVSPKPHHGFCHILKFLARCKIVAQHNVRLVPMFINFIHLNVKTLEWHPVQLMIQFPLINKGWLKPTTLTQILQEFLRSRPTLDQYIGACIVLIFNIKTGIRNLPQLVSKL